MAKERKRNLEPYLASKSNTEKMVKIKNKHTTACKLVGRIMQLSRFKNICKCALQLLEFFIFSTRELLLDSFSPKPFYFHYQ